MILDDDIGIVLTEKTVIIEPKTKADIWYLE